MNRDTAPRVAGHAVVTTASTPRRLPAGEALPPEDYRRLFAVWEAVERTPDLATFRESLLRALEEWFGYSTVVVLHGPTVGEAIRGGQGIKSGYSREFLDAYARRWITHDPYMAPHAHRLLRERGVVTLRELHPERDPEQAAFVTEFLAAHDIHDKVGMVIDAGAEGWCYVGAIQRGVRRMPARDVAVMRVLSRQLAGLTTERLAGERLAAKAGAALTPREREVASLAARGLTNEQIARRLFVGVTTVKKHLGRVLAKTGAHSRTQLAARWGEFSTR
ncbi:helix-turn-helix transcriptional regulator [Streptomyces triticirhizae]|uniref:DNA-binding response regulator n=1 Tax=Streptomyces triticirhizae TaxID=2483353 RepID=A0A3M2M5L7_9ACTN|nr:response regulator transcription factor [Streptomyces triticirhizae]RMI44851.1 DNA-binding response regulator [Streptomyces triticirhizae]